MTAASGSGPQKSLLPDGRRLHLNHGPIDLIIEAFGSRAEREACYRRAVARFDGLLDSLVGDLSELRSPDPGPVSDPVSKRMLHAIKPHNSHFVTPMAAVAGAVADEVCAAMVDGSNIERAYVNNGGDIAFYLTPGNRMRTAIASGFEPSDSIEISHNDPIRGIATSGWRGRSWSLGIADSVTVLAGSAAAADVAATLIANAVDLPGHGAVTRTAANQLDPDSDLGERLVTTGVGVLERRDIEFALNRGLEAADTMLKAGQIKATALYLAGETRFCGHIALDRIREKEPAYG